MNFFEKVLLNQRVIPVIIMYFLLPRCFSYTSWTLIIWVFAIFFSLLTLLYFIFRYNIAKKYYDKPKLIVDSIIAIAGIILACIYYNLNFIILITVVPLLFNNFKIVNDNT